MCARSLCEPSAWTEIAEIATTCARSNSSIRHKFIQYQVSWVKAIELAVIDETDVVKSYFPP